MDVRNQELDNKLSEVKTIEELAESIGDGKEKSVDVIDASLGDGNEKQVDGSMEYKNQDLSDKLSDVKTGNELEVSIGAGIEESLDKYGGKDVSTGDGQEKQNVYMDDRYQGLDDKDSCGEPKEACPGANVQDELINI